VKYEVACDRNEVAAPQVTAGRPAFLLRLSCHVCASCFLLPLLRGGRRTSDLSCIAHRRYRGVASSPSSRRRSFEIARPFFTASYWNALASLASRRITIARLNYTWPGDQFSANLLPRTPGILPEKRHSSFVIASSLAFFANVSTLSILVWGEGGEFSIPFPVSRPSDRYYDSFLGIERVADSEKKISLFLFFFFFFNV